MWPPEGRQVEWHAFSRNGLAENGKEQNVFPPLLPAYRQGQVFYVGKHGEAGSAGYVVHGTDTDWLARGPGLRRTRIDDTYLMGYLWASGVFASMPSNRRGCQGAILHG